MPQSLSSVYLHLVFSTFARGPLLHDNSFREDMHAFIAGASRTLDCPTIIVGGVEDHVHVLARFGKSQTLSGWIKEVKRTSSIAAKKVDPNFAWQAGYGLSSVDHSRLEAVAAYIRNQEEHHRKISFQDELRQLLIEHGVEWDERSLWD